MRGRVGFGVCSVIWAMTSLIACSPQGEDYHAGGGIGGTGHPTTPTETPVISSGAITGFGSVVVNGATYQTVNTPISIEGIPGFTLGDLKQGMIALVDGTITEQSRVAKSIVVENTVEGLVQEVAPDGLSMVVMAQTVLVDSATIVDPSIPGLDIRNLIPGTDIVDVHGHVKGAGMIAATFIALPFAPQDYHVKGFIHHHDATVDAFEIGGLRIEYAGADVSSMPNPTGDTWNGLFAAVQGDQFDPGPGPEANGGRLTSTLVHPEELGVQNSELAEVEGFVTQVMIPNDFLVGNLWVQTTAGTLFLGGTGSEILLGVKLEVEGVLVNQILIASSVIFRDRVKLESNVNTLNSGNHSLTLMGLPGITIQTNSLTAWAQTGNPFPMTFNDLMSGDHLKIRGRPSQGNIVVATEVERKSASTTVEVQGAVEFSADPLVTILGLAIDTSALTDNKFIGVDGSAIGRTAFFNTLLPGVLVEVEGDVHAGLVDWEEAELEE